MEEDPQTHAHQHQQFGIDGLWHCANLPNFLMTQQSSLQELLTAIMRGESVDAAAGDTVRTPHAPLRSLSSVSGLPLEEVDLKASGNNFGVSPSMWPTHVPNLARRNESWSGIQGFHSILAEGQGTQGESPKTDKGQTEELAVGFLPVDSPNSVESPGRGLRRARSIEVLSPKSSDVSLISTLSDLESDTSVTDRAPDESSVSLDTLSHITDRQLILALQSSLNLRVLYYKLMMVSVQAYYLSGYTRLACVLLREIGIFCLRYGAYHEAVKCLQQHVSVLTQEGWTMNLSRALPFVAECYWKLGDVRAYLGTCVDILSLDSQYVVEDLRVRVFQQLLPNQIWAEDEEISSERSDVKTGIRLRTNLEGNALHDNRCPLTACSVQTVWSVAEFCALYIWSFRTH
eukprot:scaffold1284_cov353-Prasinococcus_capsulatus_cf.AAC.9